jgi:aquaporin Z
MKQYIAETVGTFIFIFLTVGIDVIAPKGAGLLGIGAAFGIAYLALYYSVGRASGCHLNPVLSIGAFLQKDITLKELCIYVSGQIIGAWGAVFVVYSIVQGLPKPYELAYLGFGHNGWGKGYVDEYQVASAILVEFTGSFILALVYFTSTSKEVKGLAVGATLILLHWLGLYVTGASYNPIYSLATAFVVKDFHQLWLFIVFPILGGALAALSAPYLRQDADEKES